MAFYPSFDIHMNVFDSDEVLTTDQELNEVANDTSQVGGDVDLSNYVKRTGDTMFGDLRVPLLEFTGDSTVQATAFSSQHKQQIENATTKLTGISYDEISSTTTIPSISTNSILFPGGTQQIPFSSNDKLKLAELDGKLANVTVNASEDLVVNSKVLVQSLSIGGVDSLPYTISDKNKLDSLSSSGGSSTNMTTSNLQFRAANDDSYTGYIGSSADGLALNIGSRDSVPISLNPDEGPVILYTSSVLCGDHTGPGRITLQSSGLTGDTTLPSIQFGAYGRPSTETQYSAFTETRKAITDAFTRNAFLHTDDYNYYDLQTFHRLQFYNATNGIQGTSAGFVGVGGGANENMYFTSNNTSANAPRDIIIQPSGKVVHFCPQTVLGGTGRATHLLLHDAGDGASSITLNSEVQTSAFTDTRKDVVDTFTTDANAITCNKLPMIFNNSGVETGRIDTRYSGSLFIGSANSIALETTDPNGSVFCNAKRLYVGNGGTDNELHVAGTLFINGEAQPSNTTVQQNKSRIDGHDSQIAAINDGLAQLSEQVSEKLYIIPLSNLQLTGVPFFPNGSTIPPTIFDLDIGLLLYNTYGATGDWYYDGLWRNTYTWEVSFSGKFENNGGYMYQLTTGFYNIRSNGIEHDTTINMIDGGMNSVGTGTSMYTQYRYNTGGNIIKASSDTGLYGNYRLMLRTKWHLQTPTSGAIGLSGLLTMRRVSP